MSFRGLLNPSYQEIIIRIYTHFVQESNYVFFFLFVFSSLFFFFFLLLPFVSSCGLWKAQKGPRRANHLFYFPAVPILSIQGLFSLQHGHGSKGKALKTAGFVHFYFYQECFSGYRVFLTHCHMSITQFSGVVAGLATLHLGRLQGLFLRNAVLLATTWKFRVLGKPFSCLAGA